MEYTDIRYSDITTCIDSVSARAAQLEDGWFQWIVWGRAVSCLHNQATQFKHNWLLAMETYIRYSDITTCIDSVSARAAQLEDGWSPNELYEGEQSHAYIISTQLNTIDSLWWNTLTSGTVTLLRVLILWVPEQHNWRTDVSNELCGESSLNAYIISTQLKHNWLLVMEYTHIRYSDITTCIDSWVPELENWRTDGLQMNCVRRAVSCLHNQAPNLNTIDFLDGIHSHQVQWHYTCMILWVPELENWGTDGLQMNCVGESSLMLT